MTLTDKNYYETDSNWQFMSVSQFKDFISCEARAVAILNGLYTEDNTEAFLVGNYVHSAFESDKAHQAFVEQHDEEMKTKKGTLRAPFVVAEQMIERLKKDDFFLDLYQGEKEVIVTGELCGVNWKGKIDCLNVEEGYFVDIKTTREISKRAWSERYNKWVSFVEDYGYVLQMAVYRELLKQQYGKEFTPFIYAVTKQSPPNVQAISFLEARFIHELEFIEKNIERVMQVKLGEVQPKLCGNCTYCRGHKRITDFTEVEDLISR